MVDWHRFLIIFRTHWERSFMPLFIHSLSSHAFFIYYRGENFVREEIKTNLCTETQCIHIVGLSFVVDRKSLASQSSMTCYLGEKTQNHHSQIRDGDFEQTEISFVSSCGLPSLNGIGPPRMAYIVMEGLGLLQHQESSRVTQELSASSGEKTQCQVDQKKNGTSIKCTSLDSIKEVRKALALLPTKCENFMIISFCKALEQVRLTCWDKWRSLTLDTAGKNSIFLSYLWQVD